ncbi:MAG: nucleotidyl transferase AbiEii/AbiGii toxin family protein [Candidatus Kerfeldbacteria bacterium]|nr:nucleotidyl transferase AbiEii/AbiGii toxin family protein [Candidatus Kerfeldbacteria bacterium]
MENTLANLRAIIHESGTHNAAFTKNKLKRYLQILLLDFLYSTPPYTELYFYGGTCLAHCFGLPRLSEDLDFVDMNASISLPTLAKDIEHFFAKNTDVRVKTKIQKFRIYVKFDILHELGAADASESDQLFVKVEICPVFDYCPKYQMQFMPLFIENKSIIVRTFDLPTLMASKINAVLNRKWEKTDRSGKTIITVKGRDYFDLMWYLQKGVQPNMECIQGIENLSELKKRLLEIVRKVDTRSIQLDLAAFIEDEQFSKNIGVHMKEIILREVEEKL